MNNYFCGFYQCVNSGNSLTNLTLSPLGFIKFASVYTLIKSTKIKFIPIING